jgi:hypothetical protein
MQIVTNDQEGQYNTSTQSSTANILVHLLGSLAAVWLMYDTTQNFI